MPASLISGLKSVLFLFEADLRLKDICRNLRRCEAKVWNICSMCDKNVRLEKRNVSLMNGSTFLLFI